MAAVTVSGKRRRVGTVSTGAIERVVRDVLDDQAEDKVYDQWATAAINPIAITPLVVPIFLPPLGTGFSQRLGSQVKVKRISARILVRVNPLAAVSVAAGAGIVLAQNVRMVLVVDTQTNAAAPAAFAPQAQAIWFDTTLAVPGLLALRHQPNFKRFLVLRDEVIQVNAGKEITNREWNIHKFKGYVHFLGNGSTQADLGQNAIYLVIYSDSSANGPDVWYYTRVTYEDM